METNPLNYNKPNNKITEFTNMLLECINNKEILYNGDVLKYLKAISQINVKMCLYNEKEILLMNKEANSKRIKEIDSMLNEEKPLSLFSEDEIIDKKKIAKFNCITKYHINNKIKRINEKKKEVVFNNSNKRKQKELLLNLEQTTELSVELTAIESQEKGEIEIEKIKIGKEEEEIRIIEKHSMKEIEKNDSEEDKMSEDNENGPHYDVLSFNKETDDCNATRRRRIRTRNMKYRSDSREDKISRISSIEDNLDEIEDEDSDERQDYVSERRSIRNRSNSRENKISRISSIEYDSDEIEDEYSGETDNDESIDNHSSANDENLIDINNTNLQKQYPNEKTRNKNKGMGKSVKKTTKNLKTVRRKKTIIGRLNDLLKKK